MNVVGNRGLSPIIILMVPLLLTLLTGCETLMDMDMDKVIAPEDLSWEKIGISGSEKNTDMKQCAAGFINSSKVKGWQSYDICLLRKGYKFIPNPQELPHWEKEGAPWVHNLNDKILVECASKNPGDTLSAEELYANLDMLNVCMRNQGYTFKPSDGRYANICSRSDFFNNGIACKSTRWGFKLPPEPR